MFKVTKEFTPDQVAGLLCTAFEGGVDYWAEVVGKSKPRGPAEFKEDWKKYPLYSYPLGTGGGQARVKDIHTGNVHVLNRASIAKGLRLMAEKSPRHFGDIMSDNMDAETGDVFLQYCLLGDLVYG